MRLLCRQSTTAAASSARLSASTFTRGSPSRPSVRPSTWLSTSVAHALLPAGRAPWRRAAPGSSAASGEMCGSRPLRGGGDQIDRDGRGRVLLLQLLHVVLERGRPAPCWSGRDWSRRSWPHCRAPARSWSESFGSGAVVADGRPWKYLSSANAWPISAEPITLPSCSIRLPCAWSGKTTPRDAGHGQRIDEAGDQRQADRAGRGRGGFLSTWSSLLRRGASAVTTRSIALMPMNGRMMPPSP